MKWLWEVYLDEEGWVPFVRYELACELASRGFWVRYCHVM